MVKVVKTEKIFEPNKFVKMWNLELDNGSNYTIASRNDELFSHKPNAVHIIGMTDDKKVLAIRQFRPSINDYILDFPAGLLESDDILAEADRELREETGYTITRVDRITHPTYPCVGLTDESSVIVWCNVKRVSDQNLQHDENIEILEIDLYDKEMAAKLRAQKQTTKFYMGIIVCASSMLLNGDA